MHRVAVGQQGDINMNNAETLRRLACFSIFLAIILSTANCQGRAADEKQQGAKFVTVPIYYLTDREMTGETFGSHRRYPTHCEHHMYYGTAFVNVLTSKKVNSDQVWNALSWR